MQNFSKLCLIAGVVGLSACVAEPPNSAFELPVSQKASLEAASQAQTAEARIEADIAYLASDFRQGREAGTEAYEEAARYVAGRFASLGLEPGADGKWLQPVPLRSVQRDLDVAAMTIKTAAGDTHTLTHLDDYIIGRSIAEPSFNVSAPVIFVGYGVSAKEEGHDDYATIDVQGKIVAVFGGAPSSFNSEKLAFYRSTDNKVKTAAAHGAVGLIILPTTSQLARRPWDRVAAGASSASMTWVHPDGVGDVSSRQLQASAFMGPTGAAKLFADMPLTFTELQTRQDEDLPMEAFALNKTVTLNGASSFEEKTSSNVVGFLKGSDPALANEVLVLTAHLDHVGVHETRSGGNDHIHNGALDNAMGVAMMLDVAAKFQGGPAPKRSILFLAVTAEEKGLLGSDYFAHYPSVKADRIVANVNLDMPLMLYPFIDVIAFGAERSSLGPVVSEAASSMGVALIPDPIPEQGIFTRSDHYRFVEKGVPSVFLFNGFGNGGGEIFSNFMASHYHQPSDDINQPIMYDQAARFAELNYRIARRIADSPDRPTWNEGDFFGDKFGR